MIRLIGFDADDTLWDNETIYLEAKRKFVSLLAARVPPKESEEHLSRVETANVPRYGYGIRSFTLSMVQSAAELMGAQLTSTHVGDVLTIGENMLSAPVRLLPGAGDVLMSLSSCYRLVLITKGDTFEQGRKIRQSGLRKCFVRIEVVSDKIGQTYREVLDQQGVSPREFLMAGNSLRSDILPVLEIGAHAVYIPYEDTWEHENSVAEPAGQRHYHRISSLDELPDLVAKLAGG